MTTHTFPNINVALPPLMAHVLSGEEVGSRLGDRTVEQLYTHIALTQPWQREVTLPERAASLPAQIAETMWVLAGRNDVEWLSHYLPRAAEFSDDGQTWSGGYGPRIREWAVPDGTSGFDTYTDQLAAVINRLRSDRTSRRAVINIYDPARDTIYDGKDVPCNNWLHFLSRLGKLHLHVATRSNDVMWGWSGINAFEWSALQEIVAGMLGLQVGELHFSISSLHLYDRHRAKAGRIVESEIPTGWIDSPRFDASVVNRDMAELDDLIQDWFDAEEKIRHGMGYDVESFPEPMLRSWLAVLAWWWGDDAALDNYPSTRLKAAAHLSPNRPEKKVEIKLARPVNAAMTDNFVSFVTDLHREKDAAYGSSWKRRGELIGIMANIARKVDRLGVAGGGDTSADTAIDLLVYLVKYRLWLTDEYGVSCPVPRMMNAKVSDDPTYVDRLLEQTSRWASAETNVDLIATLKSEFEKLEKMTPGRLSEDPSPGRVELVNDMIGKAFCLARSLWHREQNETRVWKGYDQ